MRRDQNPINRSPGPALAVVSVLFVGSGFAGLVFQVLWMRELALLFGNTAQAAAATLASFFLGLAAGGAVWGRYTRRLANPLRTYAALEAAVAATALLFLALGPLFAWLYAQAYDQLLQWPSLGLALKLTLSVLLLFPAAFFMGGTLPVLSEHLARHPGHLSGRIAGLYGANTLGAAAGVLAAGFVLPQALGYAASYQLNLALVAVLAACAWLLGARAQPATPGEQPRPQPAGLDAAVLDRRAALALAAVSGFGMLALEVLWSRMFEQVLQNSVYTFAAVLAVFLGGLGIAALLASALARSRLPAAPVLWGLLLAGGLLTASTPLVFHHLTDGLGYLAADGSWSGYVITVLLSAALVMLPAILVLGAVFPYLVKALAPTAANAGALVGQLVAANTLGAIGGAMAAGFLLLETLGLWGSIGLMGGLSLAAALWVGLPGARGHLVPATTAAGLLLMVSVLDAGRLPVVRVDPVQRDENLYQVWEGSSGTVAVVRQGESLRIKVNNYYTLGSTGGRGYEERQAHFPLLLHPDPEDVFFLGLGTGITAGAALDHPVRRLDVAELLPEVVEASRRYFRPYLNGLFDDPRVTVIPEDGRHHLAATERRYDVIVGDLFIPWKAGTAGLYSLEHFRNARQRLKPGGLFAQWLPLYQLSRQEFGIIARTFLEAFPHTTLWRGDFLPDGPIIALVGRLQPDSLAVDALARAAGLADAADDGPSPVTDPVRRQLLYYAGNLHTAAELVTDFPLNTDDRPLIEQLSPRTQRAQRAGRSQWFVGEAFSEFLTQLARHSPVEDDPYLANASPAQRRAVEAGLTLFQARLAQQRGLDPQANALVAQARRQLGAEPPERESVAALQEQLQVLRASYEQALQRLEARLPPAPTPQGD